MTDPITSKILSIEDITDTRDYATAVFGDAANATTWLGSQNEELGGIPDKFIGTPNEPKVREVLARIDFGFCS